MSIVGKPRSLFVDQIYAIDAKETRRRLALVMAAVKAASIEAGGDRTLNGILGRVEGELLFTARRAVAELAEALAEHDAVRARPPPEPPAPTVRPNRLPPIPPRTSP